MIWLNNFKIAVIEEDIEKIGTLITEVPKFDTKTRAEEALALVKEATIIVDLYKSKTLKSMNKLKQTKAFLDSH